MKICSNCSCPTDYDERLSCPMCGRPYGDPEITRSLLDAQRGKSDEELIKSMADDDFAAADEYARRHFRC